MNSLLDTCPTFIVFYKMGVSVPSLKGEVRRGMNREVVSITPYFDEKDFLFILN